MLLESLMKEYFLNGSIGDLSVSHGMIAMVGLTDLKGVHSGFCSSLKEVEYNSVIHISIQFWQEPWLYGLEDETSDIRSALLTRD